MIVVFKSKSLDLNVFLKNILAKFQIISKHFILCFSAPVTMLGFGFAFRCSPGRRVHQLTADRGDPVGHCDLGHHFRTLATSKEGKVTKQRENRNT